MTIEEAIRTIIQQNKILVELIKDTENNSSDEINKLKDLVNTNKTSITNLKNIITTFGLNNQSTAQNNDIYTLREIIKSDGRLTSIFNLKQSLNTLGDNYKSLYNLATTVKTFIESTDTADNTINTWKEIENFLAGIEDSDSLISIINNLTQQIDNLETSVESEFQLLREEIDTNIANKLNELKIKDVDNQTIIKDENGVIKVNIDTAPYGAYSTDATYVDPKVKLLINNNKLSIRLNVPAYNGARNIVSTSKNVVQEQALAKHLNEVNAKIQSNKDDIQVLSGKLLILTTGAKISTHCSQSIIYKNTNTNVITTGTFTSSDTNLIPKKMTILFNGVELATSENNKIVQFTEVLNLTANNKTYNVRAEVDPNDTGSSTILTANASVNARYPIYYGFGNTIEEIIESNIKVSPTTTASRTYISTNNKDVDCYFYILVPADISAPTKFSMGGAPAAMNTTSETINGMTYKVIKSGGIYAPGTKVEITAS